MAFSNRPSNRPSQRQMEALVDFLERNPGIAKGLLRTQQGRVETRRKWQEFSTAANALGGVIKDGPGWSKYWTEKKSSLRSRVQQQDESVRRTGGGVDVLPELSLLEQRSVAVMGGESFARGDRGLAVNPFPHDTSQPSSSILDQPSTSCEPLIAVLASNTEDHVENPPAEASQQEEASPQVEARPQGETGHRATRRAPRLNPQARPNRRSVTFLETQVRRFEEIESRRVEAEMLHSQALSQIAAAMTEMLAYLRERDRQQHPPNQGFL